jgi:hypothetical protein
MVGGRLTGVQMNEDILVVFVGGDGDGVAVDVK